MTNEVAGRPRNVAVTGASGFVGRALVGALKSDPRIVVRPLSRAHLGDLGSQTDWSRALQQIDVVVHLAARVHVRDDAEAEFNRVNVAGSVSLAEVAAKLGVRRIVFLSSAGVMGGRDLGRPCSESDIPLPDSSYAMSKLMAEGALREIAESEGLELVILRPPSVYGVGAIGDWPKLLRLCRLPIPLPFGAAANRRSIISIANLCDAIGLAIWSPNVVAKTFFICDDEIMTLAEIVRAIRRGLGKPEWLVPVPLNLLRACVKFLPSHVGPTRLFSNFEIDASAWRRATGWRPVESAEEGLMRMASQYKKTKPA